MLTANDAETIKPHKAQQKLGKEIIRVHLDRYVASPGELLMHARPPQEDGPFGGERDLGMRRAQTTEPVRNRG